MAAIRITPRDARRLVIDGQRLGVARPKATRGGVLGLIRDIAYLQLDPTNVVARNPLQILWTRVGGYDTALVDELMQRRALFETPSLILPVSDLPIHLATMRAYNRATDRRGPDEPYRPGDNTGGGTWAPRVRKWLTKNQHMRRQALARLRREGPLPLTAFEDRAIVSWTSGGWNDECNMTMVLAILARRDRRRGTPSRTEALGGRRRMVRRRATVHREGASARGHAPRAASPPGRDTEAAQVAVLVRAPRHAGGD